MKKLAGIMAVLLLVTMLGGCYKSDTVLQFKSNGGVEVTATFVTTQDNYEMASYIAMMRGYPIPASPQGFLELYEGEAENEAGEILELSMVDAEGNIMEATPAPSEAPTPAPEVEPAEEASPEVTETTETPEATGPMDADAEAPVSEEVLTEEVAETPPPKDDAMTGMRLRMRFDSFGEAKSSALLNLFTQMNGSFVLIRDETNEIGIDIQEKPSLLGTKYSVSGKLDVATLQNLGGAYNAGGDEFAGASNSITFKFPFLSLTKSSGTTGKNFLGNTMTWTVTQNEPVKDVYLEVTVINPLIFAMALIILVLVIALIVVIRKKRNNDDVDTYFMDEDGNLIPVYDEEEEDFYDDTTLEDGEQQSADEQNIKSEESAEDLFETIEEIADDGEISVEDDAEEDKE